MNLFDQIEAEAVDVPAGMRVVTKEEFFAHMGPLGVHPHPRNERYSTWAMQRDGRIVGRSYPGFKYPGEPKIYMLATD